MFLNLPKPIQRTVLHCWPMGQKRSCLSFLPFWFLGIELYIFRRKFMAVQQLIQKGLRLLCYMLSVHQIITPHSSCLYVNKHLSHCIFTEQGPALWLLRTIFVNIFSFQSLSLNTLKNIPAVNSSSCLSSFSPVCFKGS